MGGSLVILPREATMRPFVAAIKSVRGVHNPKARENRLVPDYCIRFEAQLSKHDLLTVRLCKQVFGGSGGSGMLSY